MMVGMNFNLIEMKIDDIIFDKLGLTEEERKEVYYAKAELVQQCLQKVRSA